MKSKKKIIVVVVVIILLIVGAFWVKRWLNIDRCLDGGGRWNYEKGICEYIEPNQLK